MLDTVYAITYACKGRDAGISLCLGVHGNSPCGTPRCPRVLFLPKRGPQARQKKYEWISERSVSQQGLGVLYHVAITLLGEKEEPVGGEILVARVTGDHGVEVCQASIALAAQDAAQALFFLLPRNKRARHL